MAKRSSGVSAAREAALDALLEVEAGEKTSQQALATALRATGVEPDRDRRLATHLLFGVLRRKLTLDFALSSFASRGLSKLDKMTRSALRLGAYQLLYLDRIPAHAAIHQSVEQIRRRGRPRLVGFANAILRQVDRERAKIQWPGGSDSKALSIRHSHPTWLIDLWRRTHRGDALEALCESYSAPAPSVVRVRDSRREAVCLWLERFPAEEWHWGADNHALYLPRGVDPLLAEPFLAGHWCPQDEGSQSVVGLLDVRPGQRILDACAGSGTKTTQLADLTSPNGQVMALDCSADKLRELEALCARFDQQVETQCVDATRPLDGHAKSFDRVLLDAPCSGLGTVRRRPEIKWRRTPKDLTDNARRQSKILENTAETLKAGGLLAYAVCTVTAEESAHVIDKFLSAKSDQFEKVDAVPETADGYYRTNPLVGPQDSFFVALIRRKS